MPLASPAGLFALALLATSPDAEQLRLDACEAASPRIDLVTSAPGKVPVVCIGPRLSTTLSFDAPIRPESVRVEDRERFADIAVGQRTLTLLPLENLMPGKGVEVGVCFADGLAPVCATFLLVAHPGLAMQQVNVYRQQTRPVAYYEQVAGEAHAEAQQCRAEVRQLRAERRVPDGLRGALASELANREGGIARNDLTGRVTVQEGNALMMWEVFTYRANGRVAVEVWLKNPGKTPWMAAGAVLRGAKGEVLKPLPLWQPEPILPREAGAEIDPRGRVVLEVLATEKQARGTYTLTLWDAERKRTVTLGNVTFP